MKWLSVKSLALVATMMLGAASASADETAENTAIPSKLSQAEALAYFHAHGLDLLMADAAVAASVGDLRMAERVPNPGISVGAGPAFNYEANARGCVGCSKLSVQWSVSDNGAIVDSLSGKRGLRSEAMRAALAVARLERVDAERILESLVKQACVQLATTQAALDLAKAITVLLNQSLDIAKARYPGSISEGGLARTEVQKLEGDAAVTTATALVRQAQANLGFLLGARSIVPDITTDTIDFTVPSSLANATENALIERAIRTRPDLRARAYERTRAIASLELAKRQRFPDLNFSIQFSGVGSGPGAASPATLVFSASTTLPIFYQQQGEVTRSQAAVTVGSLNEAKAEAIVASDVSLAYASFVSNKVLLDRMKTGGLLDRAKTARTILETQYKAGATSLADYIDAQRTFISTNQEYLTELGAYWTAIDQLEQAVGAPLSGP